MSSVKGKYLKDESGDVISPITSDSTIFSSSSDTLKDFFTLNNYGDKHIKTFAGYYNLGNTTSVNNKILKKGLLTLTISATGGQNFNDYVYAHPVLAMGLLHTNSGTYYICPFYESSNVFIRIEFVKKDTGYCPRITAGSSDYCKGPINLLIIYYDD